MKVDPDAALIPVVVGLKMTKLPDGRDVVAGFALVFKEHIQLVESVEEIAAVLAPLPFKPVCMPAEEGWDNMRDLPPPAMAKVKRLIRGTRVAISAGAPWPLESVK